MLRHLAGAFALRALGVAWVQCMHARDSFQPELSDGRMDHREALLA
jgi:hypothetical protein